MENTARDISEVKRFRGSVHFAEKLNRNVRKNKKAKITDLSFHFDSDAIIYSLFVIYHKWRWRI